MYITYRGICSVYDLISSKSINVGIKVGRLVGYEKLKICRKFISSIRFVIRVYYERNFSRGNWIRN